MLSKKIVSALLFIGISLSCHAVKCDITQNTGFTFGCPNGFTHACTAMANLTLNCSGNGTIAMSLSQGNSNSYFPRQLTSNNQQSIAYNIFLDAANTQIFGNGSQGTSLITTNCKGICTYVFYGAVFLNDKIKAAMYQDIPILTVVYGNGNQKNTITQPLNVSFNVPKVCNLTVNPSTINLNINQNKTETSYVMVNAACNFNNPVQFFMTSNQYNSQGYYLANDNDDKVFLQFNLNSQPVMNANLSFATNINNTLQISAPKINNDIAAGIYNGIYTLNVAY